MNEKSYVSMEQGVCPVCGRTEDTGAILMDMKLRDKFDRNTVTGWKYCKEHQQQFEDGYFILVACDETKSTITNGRILPENAWRTGEIVSIRRHIAEQFFDIPLEGINFVFCQQEVVGQIQEMMESMQ